MKKNKICVVVPAYNEETQIEKVIDTMPSMITKTIIIDDCSKDRTVQIVENRIKSGNKKLVLLKHEKNQGVGGAIATGYEWARDNNYDISVVMAGDAQMDPKDLPSILEPIMQGKADYTKGNRLIVGNSFRKIPKVRFIGNSILSLLTKIASGYWHVADSQTGYTAINRDALHAIEWSKMYKRYGQPNDLLVKLNVANMRVIDVPIEPVYHVGEKSGIKIKKVIFTISWLLLKLFLWRLKEKYVVRNFHPLIFFFVFGIGNIFLSTALFARLIYLWYQNGNIPDITLLTFLFSFSLAFQSLSFAMWFDYEENKRLNPPVKFKKI